MIKKIISGGQTGADRGALDFAICHGIPHGGFCPAGRRSEDGPIPEKYRLVETSSSGYVDRTNKNVESADATLIIMTHPSPGCQLTISACRRLKKPYLLHSMSAMDSMTLVDWLEKVKPSTLNVAGHRESQRPGIGDYTYNLLGTLLSHHARLFNRELLEIKKSPAPPQ
jgi:hypothetical protein